MRYSFTKCAAIVTLAVGIGFAQTPSSDSQPGTMMNKGGAGCMHGHLDMDAVSMALNLTETQKTQASAIFEKAKLASQPIRDEMKQNREKLSAAAKANTSDAEIQRLAVEQGRLMGKLIAIRTAASAKFYQLLTPEQRTKADQMHEQMRTRTRSQNPDDHF